MPQKIASHIPNRAIPFIHVHLGLLADQVGKPSAYTLDRRQGEHDLLLSVHIGI